MAKNEKRFYVYTLSYPESMGGTVFYVGKGSKSRIENHEADALNFDRVKTYKTRKSEVIRQIWRTGGKVIKQKVAFFDSAEDAYAHERALIESIGIENLVNIAQAGQGGKRPGAGRKRGVRPRVYFRLADEDAKSLYLLTRHQRAVQNNPDLTEEQIIGELVNREWRELDQEHLRGAELALQGE